jgi:hypothetical protein
MFHGTEGHFMRAAVTERVRKHRDSLRLAGLKPIQIWIPDTRSESFHQKCERESLSLKGDPQEDGTLAWIAEVADTEGWV